MNRGSGAADGSPRCFLGGAADGRGERLYESRINAEDAMTVTATATAGEPRMNADDADRSRPGRGSAHQGRKCCWFFSGSGRAARCVSGGSRCPLAPRTPSGSGMRGSPAAAPNMFWPRCLEPDASTERSARFRVDPRFIAVALAVSASSAFIRGSIAVAVDPRPSAVQSPSACQSAAHARSVAAVIPALSRIMVAGASWSSAAQHDIFMCSSTTCRGTDAHARRTFEEGV